MAKRHKATSDNAKECASADCSVVDGHCEEVSIASSMEVSIMREETIVAENIRSGQSTSCDFIRATFLSL